MVYYERLNSNEGENPGKEGRSVKLLRKKTESELRRSELPVLESDARTGLTSEQAKEILSQEGHLIQVGEGCDGRFGLPFCKAEGVPARCCHGHTILFYRYEDGMFYAKDSAPGDGAAMCLYPEGPLTVTHQGAAGGKCSQNGKTVSYDNYANEFLVNGWCVELWSDDPADGPVVVPDSIPGE